MATLVSTGQITIVDNNDARPITAFIAANGQAQQIYTKDESTIRFDPDRTTTALVLTPKVYVGGSDTATEVGGQLTGLKWSNDLSSSIGATLTFSVTTNLTDVAPVKTYYFEGNYTDPTTGLVSHVVASIILSLVKTGTNAVYIQVLGSNVLEPGSGVSTVSLKANLLRAAGVDDSAVTYRWFKSPFGAGDQIDGNLASVGTTFGFLDTAATNASVVGAIGYVKTTAGGTSTAISTGNIPDAGWVDLKTILIHESAVADIGVFKVEARDSDLKIYQQYFTIYDVSDPYDVRLISSAGDKLQNGVGSTNVYPIVFYGSSQVTDTTGWTFVWEFYTKDSKKGSFIDTTRTAVATGRNITANTTTTITYDGVAITMAAGDVIKCVTAAGAEYFYNVASSAANTVTISAGTGNNAFLSYANFPQPTASQFVGGDFFVGTLNGMRTTPGANNSPATSQIVVTGYEIDAKGTINCSANRP